MTWQKGRWRRGAEKKGRGWPTSHLPSLHLAMTATRGRCHQNHNLKKGGRTVKIRVVGGGERDDWVAEKSKILPWHMICMTKEDSNKRMSVNLKKRRLRTVGSNEVNIHWCCNRPAEKFDLAESEQAERIHLASAPARQPLGIDLWMRAKGWVCTPRSEQTIQLKMKLPFQRRVTPECDVQGARTADTGDLLCVIRTAWQLHRNQIGCW